MNILNDELNFVPLPHLKTPNRLPKKTWSRHFKICQTLLWQSVTVRLLGCWGQLYGIQVGDSIWGAAEWERQGWRKQGPWTARPVFPTTNSRGEDYPPPSHQSPNNCQHILFCVENERKMGKIVYYFVYNDLHVVLRIFSGRNNSGIATKGSVRSDVPSQKGAGDTVPSRQPVT